LLHLKRVLALHALRVDDRIDQVLVELSKL